METTIGSLGSLKTSACDRIGSIPSNGVVSYGYARRPASCMNRLYKRGVTRAQSFSHMETTNGSLASSTPSACDDMSIIPSNGVVSTMHTSAAPLASPLATLGRHLARRLVQIGVTDVFSVPGDFNLTLLDCLIAEPGLNLVGCCNELNAGYAADGYARARGVGACVVTFTVGGLSVLNAIAGAYSDNLPIICIVGAPNSNDYGTGRILHHTIGLPDFSQELRCFQAVTCFQATVNHLEDAHELIDTAIATEGVYNNLCKLDAIPET